MTNPPWKDITPGHLAFTAADPQYVVTSLQFDSDKIITGSDSRNVQIYNVKDGSHRATLKGHDGGVWVIKYTGNTLVSASTDRTLRVWDIAKAECTHILHGHKSTARDLELLGPSQNSGNAKLGFAKQPIIISGSRDKTLRIWKLPLPNDNKYLPSKEAQDQDDCPYLIRVLEGHEHSVRAIASYGDTVVSGSYDNTIRVWRISTGEELHKFEEHNSKIYSVALDHTRNRCLSGSMDQTVKIWCLETGTLLYNLEGHTSLVGLLNLKETQIVSASADSTLRIWDAETGQCQGTLTCHTGAITSFDHDDKYIISGSDQSVKLWDAKTASFQKDLLTDLSGVWQVAFDAQRCVAAVQRKDNSIPKVSTYIEVSTPIFLVTQ